MSLSAPSAATQRNLDTSPFPVKAFALLAAFAIAIRCGMFLVCQPGTLLDTGTYQTLAQQLLHLDFRDYKGLRTPGYAVMLLLGGQNYFAVWVIQAAMGVMNTLLLFWLCFVHTGSAPWSFAAGLGHTLALNQLAFEANMVSESAATFLLVLAIASFVRALKEPARANHGVTSGLLTAVLTLIRNVYIFVGPMFAVLLLVFEKNRLRMAVGLVIAFVAPVLAWMAFNKATINYFGLTSMVGYNLTNHSGAFMEKAGDEYATVRDIYLKYREQKRAETGRHAMTIFIARDEMMAKTGLDEVGLSRVLTKLSIELFLEYPTPYLKNVADSWVSFWAVPSYFQPEKFTNLAALRFVQAVWP